MDVKYFHAIKLLTYPQTTKKGKDFSLSNLIQNKSHPISHFQMSIKT